MVLRQPALIRRGNPPYGSAVLASSVRSAAGSLFTSDPVDMTRFREKAFSFRANQHGSYVVQVNPGTTTGGPWFGITGGQGTFPASTGSLKAASFTEPFGLGRCLVKLTVTGSFSAFFGGFMPTGAQPT